MKTEDAFSIEFEITPPGHRSSRYWDDDDDYNDYEDEYEGYIDACEKVRKSVGLPGSTGSDADGPELKISLVTWKDWPKVAELCRILREKGYWASSATGAHVHFDVRKYFDAQFEQYTNCYGDPYYQIAEVRKIAPEYGRFLCAWLGFEESLFKICKTSGNRQMDWSEPLSHRSFHPEQGARLESSMQFFSRFFEGSENLQHLQILRSTGKYSLFPVTHYGSAEVRMHNGTLNDVRLAAWIELVQTMMYGAKNYSLQFYKEVQHLGQTAHKKDQYDLFKSWLTEIDPEASAFITILEKEPA